MTTFNTAFDTLLDLVNEWPVRRLDGGECESISREGLAAALTRISRGEQTDPRSGKLPWDILDSFLGDLLVDYNGSKDRSKFPSEFRKFGKLISDAIGELGLSDQLRQSLPELKHKATAYGLMLAIHVDTSDLTEKLRPTIEKAMLEEVESARASGKWGGYDTEETLIRNLKFNAQVTLLIHQTDGTVREKPCQITCLCRKALCWEEPETRRETD
jgi:hypothetical protein